MANIQINNPGKNVDISRMELLICLDYLFNKTDEKHTVKYQDVVKYGLEEYGIDNIRRQRVQQIFAFLYENKSYIKDIFKIDIKLDENKYITRYYAKKSNLTKEDIVDIVSSLENDKYLRKEDTTNLINKLVDFTCNEHEKDEILQKSKKYDRGVAELSPLEGANYRKLNKTNSNQMMLIKVNKKKFNSSNLLKAEDEDGNIVCFFYKICDAQGKPSVYFVSDKTKDIIWLPLNAFSIIKFLDDDWAKIDIEERYQSDEYVSIEDYIKKHPQGGSISPIKLPIKFIIVSYVNLNSFYVVKESFENFFGIPMQYKMISKEEYQRKTSDFRSLPKDAKNSTYTKIKHEVVCYMDYLTVKRWLMLSPEVMKCIKIVAPQILCDSLASDYIRFIRNLSNDRVLMRPELNRIEKEK